MVQASTSASARPAVRRRTPAPKEPYSWPRTSLRESSGSSRSGSTCWCQPGRRWSRRAASAATRVRIGGRAGVPTGASLLGGWWVVGGCGGASVLGGIAGFAPPHRAVRSDEAQDQEPGRLVVLALAVGLDPAAVGRLTAAVLLDLALELLE